MHYILVINGREDMRPRIDAALDPQLKKLKFDYEKYYTKGEGDGSRFVRIYCDFHPKDNVCFIACGGSGTANEVLTGIAGFERKSMAIMNFGATNDILKYYPDYDFGSIEKILKGTTIKVDVIKANDYYALNVINAGFSAHVANEGNMLYERNIYGAKAYGRALLTSLLSHRRNRMKLVADGKPMNKKDMLLCDFGNGKWCGGQYICCPYAVNDDGLMEVCMMKTMSLLDFLLILPHYEKGTQIENKFCRRHMAYCRAKKVSLTSNDLIYICYDGQVTASRSFEIEVLPQYINLVLPEKQA